MNLRACINPRPAPLPMQLKQMKEYITNRKWDLTIEVQEVGSGSKTRPKREELLKMARRRETENLSENNQMLDSVKEVVRVGSSPVREAELPLGGRLTHIQFVGDWVGDIPLHGFGIVNSLCVGFLS